MKKVLVILLVFVFAGCNLFTKDEIKENKVEKERNAYIKYVKNVKKIEKSSENLPFNIEVKYDKLKDEEVRYQVVIDNPKGEIYDIKAVAVHDKQTDDIFPSTGIFEEPMNLLPNNKPEGIILVGYIPYAGLIDNFECEIKVIIEYTYENKKHISYYVTKK